MVGGESSSQARDLRLGGVAWRAIGQVTRRALGDDLSREPIHSRADPGGLHQLVLVVLADGATQALQRSVRSLEASRAYGEVLAQAAAVVVERPRVEHIHDRVCAAVRRDRSRRSGEQQIVVLQLDGIA